MAFLHLKWATLCIIVRRSLCTYAPLIHFRTAPAPLPPTPPSRYFEPREDRKITFRSSEILLLDDFSSFFVYFFPSCFFFFFKDFEFRDITIFPPPLFVTLMLTERKVGWHGGLKTECEMFEGICFIRAQPG